MMEDWTQPTDGSTDVFSMLAAPTCYAYCLSNHIESPGPQLPRTGNNMSAVRTSGIGCGEQPNYREYLQTQFTGPCEIGQYYYAEFYVSHGEKSGYYNNNIGMYFSETATDETDICANLNLSPQINETEMITEGEEWVKIAGVVEATEAFVYMIIGNFFEDQNSVVESTGTGFSTGVYYVDDVLVKNYLDNFSATGAVTICEGESAILSAGCDVSFAWATTGTPNDIFSNNDTVLVTPTETTTYIVYGSYATDSVTVEVISLSEASLGADTTLCEGEIFLLDASFPNANYTWQNGVNDPTFSVSNTGTYWVEIEVSGCIKRDTIEVNFTPPPIIDLGADEMLCPGEFLELNAAFPNATYLWQDGSTDSTFLVEEAGIYEVAVTLGGCTVQDFIEIEYVDLAAVDLGDDQFICEMDSLILSLNLPNATFLWQDGSTGLFFIANEVGIYSVEATVFGCSAADTIEIGLKPNPEVELGLDTILCPDEFLLLDATFPDAMYEWQDGSTDAIFETLDAGEYAVTVSNECGAVSDNIFVDFESCECGLQIPNAFTPGNKDDINDYFNIIAECDFLMYQMKIFNRWGECVFSSDDPNMVWNGQVEGKPAASDVYVYNFVFENEQETGKRVGELVLLR